MTLIGVHNAYIVEFSLIFVISIVASVLSSMSGGGSSIIALPAFLSLGIPFPMAVSMQKINACFWVLPSARNYLKGEKIDWVFLGISTSIGVSGALVGVMIVLSIEQELMKRVVGGLILALVLYYFLRKEVGVAETGVISKTRSWLAYALSFPMGLYEGILGAGNGVLYASLGIAARGFSFSRALGHYFLAAFPWCVVSAMVLIWSGYFEWSLMIPTVLGSVIGGHVGSRYAKYKGNTFIRLVFLIVGGILGLKLVLGL